MKNLYPEIKPGLARAILLCFAFVGAIVGAWQYGILDRLLPTDILTWVWVSIMIAWFAYSVLVYALPYQNQVDKEVRDFHKAADYLQDSNREKFHQLFKGAPFADTGARDSRVAEIFHRISVQGRLGDDIRENIALDNLINFADAADRLSNRGKKLIWNARDLLTLGIVGTYVGISIGVGGADAIIAGDSEETRAFVAYLFGSIGLALLTTLVGLVSGSLLLNKLHEKAQATYERILNQLSIELPTGGYLGWVNKGRPIAALSAPGVE